MTTLPQELIDYLFEFIKQDKKRIMVVSKYYNKLYRDSVLCDKLNLSLGEHFSFNILEHHTENFADNNNVHLCVLRMDDRLTIYYDPIECIKYIPKSGLVKKDPFAFGFGSSDGKSMYRIEMSKKEGLFGYRRLQYNDNNFEYGSNGFQTPLNLTTTEEVIGQAFILLIQNDEKYVVTNCIIDPYTGLAIYVADVQHGYYGNKRFGKGYCTII